MTCPTFLWWTVFPAIQWLPLMNAFDSDCHGCDLVDKSCCPTLAVLWTVMHQTPLSMGIKVLVKLPWTYQALGFDSTNLSLAWEPPSTSFMKPNKGMYLRSCLSVSLSALCLDLPMWPPQGMPHTSSGPVSSKLLYFNFLLWSVVEITCWTTAYHLASCAPSSKC